MTDNLQKNQVSPEAQLRELQKENKRLQRKLRRYETQLQQLDKMASANEKININLYHELEVLSKQAEEQAREAQIEAALERVRARTMAMHHSDELAETAGVLFEQMKGLGIIPRRCVIGIFDRKQATGRLWYTTSEGKVVAGSDTVPLTEQKNLAALFKAWKRGEPFHTFELAGDARVAWTHYAIDRLHLRFPEYQPEAIDLPQLRTEPAVLSSAIFSHGVVMLHTTAPLAEEDRTIITRFAGVFEQTYTRFLDLKQAEHQAREAQIEAALERVRARSMGMHYSKELIEVVRLLDKEIKGLGIQHVASTQILTDFSNPEEGLNVWITAEGMDSLEKFHVPFLDDPLARKLYEALENGENSTEKYSKSEKNRFFKLLFKYSDFKRLSKERRAVLLDAPGLVRSVVIGKNSALLFQHYELDEFSEDDNTIFKRFGAVFEQSYTRFLDLQKAEAQAREAKIEAALERVRSRTMAMHESTELAEVAVVLFTQLQGLGIAPYRLYIGTFEDDSGKIEAWTTDEGGTKINARFTLDAEKSPVIRKTYNGWKARKKSITLDVRGTELEKHYHYIVDELHVPVSGGLSQQRRVQTIAYFSQGFIAFSSSEMQPPEIISLLERFAGVFGLTYTRFNDLRRAEARAREAEQQASLDRIRAEIASMRTADDLNRITPLIWRELTTLGVPFFRCGVFILDEASEQAHVYLSNPTGKSLAVMHMDFDSSSLVSQTVEHWRQKKIYREQWNQKQFIDWTRSLVEQGFIRNLRKYQAGEEAPAKLALQLVPFTQGMLYIGSAAPLSDDEINLAKKLADAFSVAYSRYEDFKKLEAAKTEVEAALENLKKTQNQLIQAEKMASLGQLTAGIAHEIKNPLNFVNNFAELSGELLEELREELQKRVSELGNRREIEAILNDLQQNAQKINEHGKRADSIVKGMLQHSRGGKGERQSTDLNALLDEDLTLAYHGLRAKDSSFNVTIDKHFDPSLGKISLVPQDISRVFLNIITNGFFAVHERRQQAGKDFSPILAVQTRRDGDRVEIRIRDNGSGIPADIREKIFQPFFTTKPAGQGTGLGLSISYDIVVQEHHGEIRVDSREGEYTEFIITLPVNANTP